MCGSRRRKKTSGAWSGRENEWEGNEKTDNSNPINSVYHKTSDIPDLQRFVHNHFTTDAETKAERDWRDKVENPEKYNPYREKILKMLEEFECMWDSHIGRFESLKNIIELVSEYTRPIRSAPYRARPDAGTFEMDYVLKLVAQGIIEPAQTKWASRIVFASKKARSLRFWVNYRNLNGLTILDSYLVPHMDYLFLSLGYERLFTSPDENCAIRK